MPTDIPVGTHGGLGGSYRTKILAHPEKGLPKEYRGSWRSGRSVTKLTQYAGCGHAALQVAADRVRVESDGWIRLASSRPYRPQTNGNPEMSCRRPGAGDTVPQGLSAHIHCNGDRLHGSPDICPYETPLKAFISRKSTEETSSSKWACVDVKYRHT